MDVYDFSVNYDAIVVEDIHKYLMKKHGSTYIKCLDLLNNVFYNNEIF